jgi:hypothetical protein
VIDAVLISHPAVSLRQQLANLTGPQFGVGVALQDTSHGKHEHAKFVPLDLRNTPSQQSRDWALSPAPVVDMAACTAGQGIPCKSFDCFGL